MTQPDTGVIGNQLPQPDPRGWLVFDQLPDELQRAEDSTLMADQDYAEATRYSRSGRYVRPATDAERTLLQHLGYQVPDKLRTHVEFATNHVRRRRWPALELQAPINEGEQP